MFGHTKLYYQVFLSCK